MDVRQYGPALFPSLKQVRRMLYEGRSVPGHARDEPLTGEWSRDTADERGETRFRSA